MKNTNKKTSLKGPGRPPLYNEPTKDVQVRLPLSLAERLKEGGSPLSEKIRNIIELYYQKGANETINET